MKKVMAFVMLVAMLVVGCVGTNHLYIYPRPLDFQRDKLPSSLVSEDDKSAIDVDLRSYDLSDFNLMESLELLDKASFDVHTKWPDNIKEHFDYQKVMELGKNPGLGLNALHKRGIDGSGVSVAIIDQTLLIDHIEYQGRIKSYKEINITNQSASMHGAGVTSILGGKNVGVAPKVNIHYVACDHANWVDGEFTLDFSYLAMAIDHIIKLNNELEPKDKIRVISISRGFDPDDRGYDFLMMMIDKAKEEGIWVVTTSNDKNYGFSLLGLGRQVNSNPEEVSSYIPGAFYRSNYPMNTKGILNKIGVPMDSRTTASPTGNDDYVFYYSGGLSWAVPYLSGVYALACQVKPDITPDEFMRLVVETSFETDLDPSDGFDEKELIINPNLIIKTLEAKN